MIYLIINELGKHIKINSLIRYKKKIKIITSKSKKILK